MTGRRHNPRRAKSLSCYSIAEAAELYGVHRNTVRHWLANGLVPIDKSRPVLIHGAALNGFHASRRAAAKRVCGPGEVYCLTCRMPRRPAGDMADYASLTRLVGTISAICPECGRIMTQRVNAVRLKGFIDRIDVVIRPGPKLIDEAA